MTAAPPPRLRTVCFDLDDTLFPQSAWLAGAWDAVAARASSDGVDRDRFRDALDIVAAEGSDRGQIIDRALLIAGAGDADVDPLVATFRAHRPVALEPYPGVRGALRALAAVAPVALVSDGDPSIQQAKLEALGLAECFTVVVWSDEHGREHRKPDPLPFRIALERLDCPPEESVSVGDRPEKDVAGAAAIGMHAVRVRTGEWRAQPDDERAWASVDTAVDACDVVFPLLARTQGSRTPASTRNSNSPGANR